MACGSQREEEILRAIGTVKDLPKSLQRALNPGNDFESMPVPNPGDWLAEHAEQGQSFDDFVRMDQVKPERESGIVYLQPWGNFIDGQGPSLEKLQEYAASYFMLKVKLLPARSIANSHLTTRRNPAANNWQILTHGKFVLMG
jgi:hypothetical protein